MNGLLCSLSKEIIAVQHLQANVAKQFFSAVDAAGTQMLVRRCPIGTGD